MSENQSHSATTSVICKAYVREMLELNPMWQSSLILRRRRELWAGTASNTTSLSVNSANHCVDAAAKQQLHLRAKRCLETLQKEFYQLPSEKVQQYLQFLNKKHLPEYVVRAKRLRSIARHRDALRHVEQETHDSKFAYSLLHGLIASPANAGALHELYLESIIADKRVIPACNMVRQFVDRHPEIYDLERDWFNVLLDAKNQKEWDIRSSPMKALVFDRLKLVGTVVGAMFLMMMLPFLFPDSKIRSNSNRDIQRIQRPESTIRQVSPPPNSQPPPVFAAQPQQKHFSPSPSTLDAPTLPEIPVRPNHDPMQMHQEMERIRMEQQQRHEQTMAEFKARMQKLQQQSDANVGNASGAARDRYRPPGLPSNINRPSAMPQTFRPGGL